MKAAILILPILLTGCASWDGMLTTGVDYAQKAQDRALRDAEFVICYAASKGAVDRRYGGTEQARIYSDFCRMAKTANVQPEQ